MRISRMFLSRVAVHHLSSQRDGHRAVFNNFFCDGVGCGQQIVRLVGGFGELRLHQSFGVEELRGA